MINHSSLTEKIGYSFKNPELLAEALTHPSCLGLGSLSAKKSYERLEFLGDSVLNFIITDFLIKNFPEETEGELTKRRSSLVNSGRIATIGRELGMIDYMSVGTEDEFNQSEATSIIEDITEALLGAMYLDGGIEDCTTFVMKYWQDFLFKAVVPEDDPKTFLQEWSQKRRFGIPQYELISKSGDSHSPVFTIEVKVGDLPVFTGASFSKKLAEKEAARELIKYIQSTPVDEQTKS
jgi:ribonuclease-3